MTLKARPRADIRQVKIGHLAAVTRFFRDPDASLFGKLFVVLAMAYVVMPVDAIPDVVPFLGWLDDLGVMGMAMAYMARVVARYREPQLLLTPVRRG